MNTTDLSKLSDAELIQLKNSLVNEVSKSNNMQMALKILLNSAYGALTNEWFRYFSINLGEAITYGGQLSIKWAEHHINRKLNSLLKTTNQDFVIASDTDSLYITLEKLINKMYTEKPDTLKIVRTIDEMCKEVFQPFINEFYAELAEVMNAYDQKMFMKRENIANRGIWMAKKKYILNVWNEEGVEYTTPKLKIMGVDAIKSSTPYVCRQKIKDSIEIIMNKTNDDLIEFINTFRDEHSKMKFEQIAEPSGVTEVDGYMDAEKLYKKGTPINSRASILFNHLLSKHKLLNKYPKIQSGDKIKYSYLTMPNPIRENVIACIDELPVEFGLEKYIDYNHMFNKKFIEPIKQITDVIGWQLEKRNTIESFFA